jgi:hypothetical protein
MNALIKRLILKCYKDALALVGVSTRFRLSGFYRLIQFIFGEIIRVALTRAQRGRKEYVKLLKYSPTVHCLTLSKARLGSDKSPVD